MESQNYKCKPCCSRRTIYLLVVILISIIGLFVHNRLLAIKLKKLVLNNPTFNSPITSNQILRQYHVPEEYAVMMYQMLKDMHELFEKHNISYFVEAGTLLGAVRHKGIVPHDDDIDIGVRIEDYPKILSLHEEFAKLGYYIPDKCEPNHWFQIQYQKYKGDQGAPIIDLFPYKKVITPTGVIYNNYVWAIVSKKDNSFFYEEDLYPLKKYRFGSIEVYGPNNPRHYLSNVYGYDWDTISYIRQPHLELWLKKQGKALNKPLGNNRIILSGEMFNPLEITIKLADRVK
jgi:lipopolysaccharide cholinephosphotransferase